LTREAGRVAPNPDRNAKQTSGFWRVAASAEAAIEAAAIEFKSNIKKLIAVRAFEIV
jgi:hypothetical protein